MSPQVHVLKPTNPVWYYGEALEPIGRPNGCESQAPEGDSESPALFIFSLKFFDHGMSGFAILCSLTLMHQHRPRMTQLTDKHGLKLLRP